MFHFNTPWKKSENRRLFMFSGEKEVKHWLVNTRLKSLIKTLGQRVCYLTLSSLFDCWGCLYFCFWGVLFFSSSVVWYHLYNLRDVKKTHGGVLILVKLQALACTFTKINTPPWVFHNFFKIVLMVPNCATHQIFCRFAQNICNWENLEY